MTLSWSMDQVGPICRSVEDCAIVLNGIRGSDPNDRATVDASFNFRATAGMAGLKIGYVPGKISSSDLAILSSLGATPTPITWPAFPSGAMISILAVEGAAAFDGLTRSGGLNLINTQGPYDMPNLLRTARTVSAVDYLQADRLRLKLVEQMMNLFETVDLIVAPEALDHSLAIGNLIGLPCVCLPHGNGASLLVVGHLYDEALVLQAAKAYQDATSYHLARPPLFTN